MDFNEQKIREHLKKLSVVDIADSVYLFGINFDKDSMDSIMSAIFALYNEVIDLKDMVERDFESRDGEKVLMPSTPQSQAVVIGDYYRKSDALTKVMASKEIRSLLGEYIRREYTEQDSNGRARN